MTPAAWIKSAASIPLRAWRLRGFGIHSPYAYSFVTTVLRHTESYYAYPAIGSSRHNKRLFRVILALAPADVVRSGPLSDGQHAAIGAALAGIAAPLCHKAVIVSPEAIVGIAYLKRILADGGAVVFTDLRDTVNAEIFTQIAPCGMTFQGLRMAVITGNSKLPRQRFQVLI